MSRPHPALVALASGCDPPDLADTDDGLFASSLDHGMYGLLWSWVRDHAPSYSERAALGGLDVVTQRRHRQLTETIAAVQRTLTELQVDVATFKGVTAERRWYARAGERPCFDVDLLVAPDALGRADAILDALDPHHPLRGDINDLVARNFMQSVNLVVDGVPVDLHFDLLKIGIPTRGPDVVWERMERHLLAEKTSVRVPDAEMSLVNFLVHLNKDGFSRLLGFVDIARIVAGEDLDWAFVERFLGREGLEVVGFDSLRTVADRLGLPVAQIPRVHGMRARAWPVVWPARSTLLGSAGTHRSRRQDLIPFFVRGRVADALHATRRTLVPHPATVALQYQEVPGPNLRRLVVGRVHTAWQRRRALRARRARPARAPAPEAPDGLPRVTAGLLRRRADLAPLWVDVRGRSMGWSIVDGARVRIEVAPRPRRGEVWAFVDDHGHVVVHRYRGKVGDGHRFQGDARVRPDAPVASEQLIGRVVAIAPTRPAVQWGPLAGAVQRVPRVAVATAHRSFRRARRIARR
ncbi:MAG: nucleotidyltransferase family protein [Acidimicrobiia bacterium]